METQEPQKELNYLKKSYTEADLETLEQTTKEKQVEPISTGDIAKRKGFYHCPDRLPNGKRCKEKFTESRYLGRHRTVHGVLGTGASSVKKRQKIQREKPQQSITVYRTNGSYPCPMPDCVFDSASSYGVKAHLRNKHQILQVLLGKKSHQKEGENNGSIDSSPATRLVPSHVKAKKNGKGNPWTPEALSGFLYAHLDTHLENASQGDPSTRAHISQRLTEFLSHSVLRSGLQDREGSVRNAEYLSPMFRET